MPSSFLAGGHSYDPTNVTPSSPWAGSVIVMCCRSGGHSNLLLRLATLLLLSTLGPSGRMLRCCARPMTVSYFSLIRTAQDSATPRLDAEPAESRSLRGGHNLPHASQACYKDSNHYLRALAGMNQAQSGGSGRAEMDRFRRGGLHEGPPCNKKALREKSCEGNTCFFP